MIGQLCKNNDSLRWANKTSNYQSYFIYFLLYNFIIESVIFKLF